jgi:hypothetical protein
MHSPIHLLLRSIAFALAVLPVAPSHAAPPPQAVTVTGAVYRVKPQENRLQVVADLELRQSSAGTQTLPIDLGAMSLESATLDGRPAPLMRHSDGRVLLVVGGRRSKDGGRTSDRRSTILPFRSLTSDLRHPTSGSRRLQIQLSAPLHRIGRDRVAVVTMVANAPATLAVELPADRSLQIDGRLVSSFPSSSLGTRLGEKTEHTVAVGNRKRVELRFASGSTARRLDSVVLAESRSTLALSAGLADWKCETQFLVTGTPRKTFESSITGRMQLTGVSGPDVDDWSVSPSKDDPSRSTVRVTFRRPFTGTRSVQFTGRTALPTEPFWQVPNFVIDGVDSHAGHVAVSFPRNDGIRVDEFAGLRQSAGVPGGSQPKILPVSNNDSIASSRRVLAFDFWKQDFELNLVLSKRRSVSAADVVTVFDVRRNNVRMEFVAALDAPGTLSPMPLSLPAEWSIRGVTMNGKPADWKTLAVEADVQHLRIALPAPSNSDPDAGSVRVALTAVRDLEYPEKPNAAAVWKLPVVRLPDSRLMRGRIFVRGSDDVAVGITDADRLLAIPGRGRDDRFAYRYTSRHGAGSGFGATVAVRPRPPAFSVESLTVARLDRAALRTEHRIRITPGAAGFRTLELQLPRNAKLQSPIGWQGSGGRLIHRERLSTDAGLDGPPASHPSRDPGGARWKLRFDRTIHQPGRLSLQLSVKRLDPLQQRVELDCVRFPRAERMTGFLVVLADARQRLDVAANYRVARAEQRKNARPLPLDAVNIDDVLHRFHGHDDIAWNGAVRVAAAYRYVLPNIEVTLAESRLPADAAETLTCSRQSLQTVLSKSGALQHCAEYELTGVDRDELRVQLPDGAELWAAMCDGKPIEVRREGDSLRLRIARGWLIPDRTRLRLIYYQKQEAAGGAGRLHMLPPVVALAAGTQLPLSISSSVWTLYHPQDMNIVDAAGEFRPVQPLDERGWLKRLGGWIAAKNFLLLILLLAVPFGWIALRFLRFVADGRHVGLSEYHVAGCLLAVVLVFAVTLSGGRQSSTREAADASVSFVGAIPASVAPAGAGLANVTVQQPVRQSIVVGDGDELPGKRTTEVGRSARLSVPVEFEPSQYLGVKRFEYLGTADEPVALNVTYQSHGAGFALRLCVFVGMLIGCWMLRQRSRRLLATIAVLGMMLPAALAGWFPAEWQPVVDGVFFGTLAGVVAWGAGTTVARFRQRRRIVFGVDGARLTARVLARLLPLTALFVPTTNLIASDAKPTAPSAFVSAADYVIAVKDESADPPKPVAVTARFRIVSRTTEAATVALPLGRVAVTSAALDGEPAVVTWRTIASEGGQREIRPHVVVSGGGSRTLTLAFSLPLKSDAGGMQLVLPVRPVASGRGVIKLPSNKMQVRFRGLVGAYHRTIRDGKAIVEFPVDRSRDVTLRLSDKAIKPPSAASVLVDSAASHVEIKDSGIFQHDSLTLRVASGGLDHWTCKLPDAYRVIGIGGPDVAGWELSASKPEDRTVRIDFRRPLTGSTTVVLNLFRAERFSAEPASITLQQIRSDFAPSRRTMAVSAGREFVIRDENSRAATRVGARWEWQLTGSESSVALHVSRRMPQTSVAAEHAVMLDPDEVRISSRLAFDFHGSPRTKLTLLLPDGYTLQSLRGSHDAEWSHGADESTVIVVFPKPQSGTVRIVLDGTIRRKPSAARLELMLPGPMAASRQSITAGFWNAGGSIARLKSSDGWRQLANGEIPAAIRARQPQPPTAVLQTSSPEPNPVAWELTQPASRIQADTLTLIRVTNTAVRYTLLMKWSGLAGPRRSVALSVPQWIGRKLEFRSDRHLRIEPDLSTHDGDDRMRWIVTSFGATREIALVATAKLPPPLAGGGRVAAPKLELLERAGNGQTADGRSVEYTAIKRPRHFVVLLNESDDRLQRATGAKFREFAVADLPTTLRVPGSLRDRFTRATARLRTDESAAEPVWIWKPVLAETRETAVVTRAELTTLLERDGSWRTRAVYHMKSGSRPYLAIRLPADSRLLATEVAGRHASSGSLGPRSQAGAWERVRLVPLPRHSGARRGFAVRLLIAGRLPDGSFRGRGLRSLLAGTTSISLPSPSVVSRKEDAALGIPVQETLWTVRLPDGLTATPASGVAQTNMNRAVAKPTVPASGWNAESTRGQEDTATAQRSSVNDADALFEAHCRPLLPGENRGGRIDRTFSFPLDDTKAVTTPIDREPRIQAALHTRSRWVAQPWAASVESANTEPPVVRADQDRSESTPPDFGIPVPRKGQVLVFRKAGGDPQLTLTIRTREATRSRRRILWSLVWATFGVVALLVIRRRSPARKATVG